MIAIETIMNQVLQNCNIADSQHAGLYSICGLALRLRGLVIKATAKGFNTARYHAEAISDIFQKGMQKNDKQWIENEIAMRLLRPLGVT